MPERTATFRVRLEHSRRTRGRFDLSDDDERAEFWKPFVQLSTERRRDGAPSISELENRFRRRLPLELSRALTENTTAREESFPIVFDQTRAPRFAFEITEIRYGSMDLGVAVEPLENAVKFFDGHFDYFRVALEGFVPLAISNAIYHTVGRNPEGLEIADQLDCAVSLATGLEAAFRNNHSAADGAAWTTRRRAEWAWIAANTSLLVPTAVAAAYLWVANQNLREDAKEKSTWAQSVARQGSDLATACYQILQKTTATQAAEASGRLAKPKQR